jgi:hypothetical protein
VVTAAAAAPPRTASVWLSGYQAARTRFPPRPAAAEWPATAQSRDQVAERLAGLLPGKASALEALLEWLAGQDGGSWQQRWLASGADTAGAAWWQLARGWLHQRPARRVPAVAALVSAQITAVCADIVRPSLAWLVAGGRDHGELARTMAALRDPGGFARLRALCDSDPAVSKTAGSHTLRRAAVILAARGGTLDGITIGDLLELLDTEAQVHGAARSDSAACYRLLREMGIFGPAAPARLRQLRTAGQRTPEEMIDRHQLACRPIRDLLVDYLRERQPAIDYGSLEQLGRRLGMFWADLEAHHPGIDSLHLSTEVADAWKQRMRTKPQTITTATGKTVIDAERICHREFLTPVRAFYLDLAQWAVDDPGRWAQWAVPCPIGRAETIQGKVQRLRKSRMDARTRERLPVLPVLVRSAASQHAGARALLQAARSTRPGHAIIAPGAALTRSVTGNGAVSVWADDPATGKRRNLTAEEDRAFWAWATVEILRATGVFSMGADQDTWVVLLVSPGQRLIKLVQSRNRCGGATCAGVSWPACRGVELCHELAVGGPGRGEVVIAFGDLEPQVDGLLLVVGELLIEGIDVGGRAEPGFAPCLLAERLGQPFLELVDAGVEPDGAFVGCEQVGLQRGAGDGRAGSGGRSRRDGFKSVDLGEQVAVAVKEGAVHCRCAGDARDAYLGAVCVSAVERGDDTLAAPCGVGLAAVLHRFGSGSRLCHAIASLAGEGGLERTDGMPRFTARCLRTTVMASSIRARSPAGRPVRSPLTRLMSLRMRVISSSAGVASARAHSSTPSMAAVRRSRVRSRSSR